MGHFSGSRSEEAQSPFLRLLCACEGLEFSMIAFESTESSIVIPKKHAPGHAGDRHIFLLDRTFYSAIEIVRS
jgi:hypothetical protein